MNKVYDDRIFDFLTPEQKTQAIELRDKGIPLCVLEGFYRDHRTSRVATCRVVNVAIKIGLLKRPPACQECGKARPHKDGREPIQAHHDDYNKPLEIRWLCAGCHSKWHMHNKPIEKLHRPPTADEVARAEARLARADQLRQSAQRLEKKRQRQWESVKQEVGQLRATLNSPEIEHSD